MRQRADVDRDRERKRAQTEAEIDAIYAEYRLNASRATADAVAALYARFSTRFQDSIADQVRGILEEALRLNIYVPRDMIFYDEAVRGVKNRRTGLDALKAVLKRRGVSALLLFSTSRLFRKLFRTLEFVEQVHKAWGIRCVFVKSGVDTNDKRQWEHLLAAQSLIDQFVVTMHVDNIRASHMSQLEKGLVYGTLSFGYHGDPIPGEVTKRGKPRCRTVINEEEAEIVRQIFAWYVDEGYSIEAIVRMLNDIPDVPLPPRSDLGEWTKQAVRGVLTNARYRGLWEYGKLEAVYLPDADYTSQRPRPQPLKERQIEELRIVPDHVWFAAQERLKREGHNRGRRPKGDSSPSSRKIVNGLLRCAVHTNQILHVSGNSGRFMVCPACQRYSVDQRYLFTFLDRQLAVERTCKTLADLIRGDDQLVQAIIEACQAEAAARQTPDASRRDSLQQKLDQATRSIDFTMRNVGQTPEEQRQSQALLADLRREQAQLVSQVRQLESMHQTPIRVPEAEEVHALLGELGSILLSCSHSKDPEQLQTVRHVIDCMIDGRIEVHQCGEKTVYRGWLEGRCRVRVLPYLLQRLTGEPSSAVDDGVEVVIDFRRPDTASANRERAWSLLLSGKAHTEIGAELGFGQSTITKMIHQAAARRGIDPVGLRRLRFELRSMPGRYAEIADEVMTIWSGDGKPSFGAIAKQFGCCEGMVKVAIDHWHSSRELPSPDLQSNGHTEHSEVPTDS